MEVNRVNERVGEHPGMKVVEEVAALAMGLVVVVMVVVVMALVMIGGLVDIGGE